MKTLLSYKESKTKEGIRVTIEIAINLSNHIYLSVCGEVHETTGGRPRLVSCGQCTDEMCEFFPEYHDFMDLHLSDINGEPMYAIENGLYFLNHNYSIDVICSHFRIDKEEAIKLWAMSDGERVERICSYRLRWQREMFNAISRLEQMCGKKLELP